MAGTTAGNTHLRDMLAYDSRYKAIATSIDNRDKCR